MLRFIRGGQRWLTALFVVGIGGVFVFFLGLQGPLSGSSAGGHVVKVGHFEFGLRDFERVRARRESAIQQELGSQFDARALRDTLDNLAARELVDRALLALAAEELGLTVSKAEIERLVLSDPGFRDESGRFNRQAFEDYAEYEYGNQRALMADRRLALLSLKMLRLLNGQPEVSEGEARAAVRSDLAEVRIAFVALEAQARSEDVTIAPEALQAALESRGDEIAALYEERDEQYNRPERVRARHILRSLDADAPEAETERVQGELEAALVRLEAGESFETLAQELSQDPGSQSTGGDLGFFGRGAMVPEFEEAAFALEPGGTSEIVRSSFGLHLIRVEEREDAVSRPLDEVREELAEELLRLEAVNEAAVAQADELAEAIRAGQSLEEAAREREIDLQRSGWLSRRAAGFVPELGAAPDVLAAAYSLEAGESSPEVFEVADKLALVQVLEHKAPGDEEIEAMVDEKREQLLAAKRGARTDTWINVRREQLVKTGELVVNMAAIQGS